MNAPSTEAAAVPTGIVTVLNTPFTRDNELDTSSLALNVGRGIDAGVGGFLVPAMASEVGKLSRDERRAMVECVLAHTTSGAAVIAGCSASTQQERIVGKVIRERNRTGDGVA